MKVNIKRPNITQYHFIFEPSDEIYINCMWSRINLDHDTFTMTATSDCGDYSYRWLVTDHETFAHLMARIDGDYLLGKISDNTIFDFEASKAELLKYTDRIDALADIEYCSEEMFIYKVNELVDIDLIDIPIVKKYPRGAQTFVKIFTECLQPLLREQIKEADKRD